MLNINIKTEITKCLMWCYEWELPSKRDSLTLVVKVCPLADCVDFLKAFEILLSQIWNIDMYDCEITTNY